MRPKVYAIKIDSKNSVFTKKLIFIDFSIRKNKPIKHVKRIHFGCHWSPDLYKLLNVAVDPEQTTRIPLYAKNVLPWSNTPNKNEWQLTLHGSNHILTKFLQDKTSFQFLSRQFPQKNIFRHSKKKRKKKKKKKKEPATEMAKIKFFLVGLGRLWGKKQYFGLIHTKIYCNDISMTYNSIHLFFQSFVPCLINSYIRLNEIT